MYRQSQRESMKIYENFTATVEQLIWDLNPIVIADPAKTLDFNFYGTTFFIDGIKSWLNTDNLVILSSSPHSGLAISAKQLLEKLKDKKRTAKVLLQGNWMLYDLKKFDGETIFHYSDTGDVLFDWEDCDVRLLTAQQLINDLISFSDDNPDRKVAYLDLDKDMKEKLHYFSNPHYLEDYGVYVMSECDATACATVSSLIGVLSANPDYAQKGVVVYHNKECYKTISFDSAGVFFDGKDGDDDIIAFRIFTRPVRKNDAYLEGDVVMFQLQKWCFFASHHKSVDLGLSVNWATCNVGAETPDDYGFFFAWGEVWPSHYSNGWRPCTKDNYKFYHNGHYTKYCSGEYTLNPCDDVAHVHWGEGWRLPTKEEFEELIQKCKWEWTRNNSREGYKVTGPSGNSIFLPAAGFYFDDFSLSNDYSGMEASYWSSTGENERVYVLDFDTRRKWVKEKSRYYGIPVRAVCPKNSAINPSKKILDILNEHPDAIADWGFKNPVETSDGLRFDIYTTGYHPGWVHVIYDDAEGTYILHTFEEESGNEQEVGFVQEAELFEILDKLVKEGLSEEEIESIRKNWFAKP